jgi:hypothetical protein
VSCNGDVLVDVDHLHIKKIYLIDFSYIVIDDKFETDFENMSTPSLIASLQDTIEHLHFLCPCAIGNVTLGD